MLGVPTLVPCNVQEPIYTFSLITVIFLKAVISHSIHLSLFRSSPLKYHFEILDGSSAGSDPDCFNYAGESWTTLLLTCPLELVIFNLLCARFCLLVLYLFIMAYQRTALI